MTLKLQFVVEAIDNATAKVREVNRAVEKSREPWLKVRASAREFFNEAGFTKLQRQMETIRERGAGIVAWGRNAATAFTLASAAGGAAFFGLKRVADVVDHVNDTALSLGMTTQILQRAGFAAQMNGSSLDEMSQSLVFLNKNMAEAREGNKDTVQWMRRAGITATDLKNRNFTAADALERIADTFQRVGDKGDNSQRKIALTTQLMGRQGYRMIQLLNGGSAALRDLYKEADRLGVTLSTETVKSMTEFNDSWDRMKMVAFGNLANAARPLMGVLQGVVDRITTWRLGNRELMAARFEVWVAKVEAALPAVWNGIKEVAGAVAGLAAVANSAAEAVGGWGNALKIVGALIALKLVVDIGLLVAAVATALPTLGALATALWGIAAGFTTVMAWPLLFAAVLGGAAYIIWDQWKPISEFFSGLWAKVKGITSAVVGFPLTGHGAALGGAPSGASAIPPGGMQKVGGTLRIYFDDKGRPRVDTMQKTPGSLLDLAVDTGPVMFATN